MARAELKTRADQLSDLLKDEKAANIANKAQQQADIDKAKAEVITTAQQLIRAQNETENARIAERLCQAKLDSELQANAAKVGKLETSIDGLRAELEKEQKIRATLDGKLIVYESIGMLGKS